MRHTSRFGAERVDSEQSPSVSLPRVERSVYGCGGFARKQLLEPVRFKLSLNRGWCRVWLTRCRCGNLSINGPALWSVIQRSP